MHRSAGIVTNHWLEWYGMEQYFARIIAAQSGTGITEKS